MRYNTLMDLMNVNELRTAMQIAGVRARKSLGQHFLVDRPSLEAVMGAAKLTKNDTVLEIGPGLGVMTTPLAKMVKRVVAVETDRVLAELLAHDAPPNLDVVHEDIMRFNLSSLPSEYKVVANIPYYLTSSIIRVLLEADNQPRCLVLLVQKEVAERIVAKPGQMSILALSVQYYGRPEVLQTVDRHRFWPAPKVDSAILRVEVYHQPAFKADRSKLFRLIKAGFGEKRKMLRNSLAGGLNTEPALAEKLIRQAGLVESARAQELDLEAWQRLYQAAAKYELL